MSKHIDSAREADSRPSRRRYKVERWATRPDVVLVPRLVRQTRRADTILCTGPLQVKSGELSQTVLTFTAEGQLRVQVSSFWNAMPWPAFVGSVPVAVTPTPAGHSFKGSYPCIFGWGSACTNGNPRAFSESVQGTIATTPAVDTLEYVYTVEVYCGDALSCVENGTFKGERQKGADGSTEGTWVGQQSWSTSACVDRQLI